MRPGSLAEVAGRTAGDPDWDHHLRDFLDAFYAADGDRIRQASMIGDEPDMLGMPHADAFVGGTGEHLARRWHLPIPEWVRHPGRYLDLPLYVPGDPKLRPFLMVTSPVAFRVRLIFTGADPLQRARFPYGKGGVTFRSIGPAHLDAAAAPNPTPLHPR